MDAIGDVFRAVAGGLYASLPWIAVTGAILAAGAAAVCLPALWNDRRYARLQAWSGKPALADRYRDTLTAGLRAANRVYGSKKELPIRGCVVSLIVAMIYLVFLWHLSWVLGGPVTLAGVNLFDDSIPTGQRWICFLFFWVALALAVLFLAKLNQMGNLIWLFAEWLTRRVKPFRHVREAPIRKVVWSVVTIGSILGFAGAVGLSGTERINSAFGFVILMIAVLGAVYGALALWLHSTLGDDFEWMVDWPESFGEVPEATKATGREFLNGIKAGACIIAGMLYVYIVFSVGERTSAVLFCFVFIALPLVNAASDLFSVAVSQRLLFALVKRRTAAWRNRDIAGAVLTHTVRAVLCVLMLVLLFPLALAIANYVFAASGRPVVYWGGYILAALEDPFGAGLLTTGMLLTPLLPAVLHVLATGCALLVPVLGRLRLPLHDNRAIAAANSQAGLIVRIALAAFLSWLAFVALAVLLWHLFVATIGPLGAWLADLAIIAGQAIGSPGAPGL